MNNDTRPIGFFDSGIGGTTIWHAVHQLLPYENTLFLGDSMNAPYGQKSVKEIIQLSHKNTQLLLKHNAKMIIVACNTATTNAIYELRNTYDIPFIGIEPAIKPAAENTKTKAVGVLATQGTLNSKKYSEAQILHPNIQFINQIGHGIVQLIEAGKLHTEEMKDLLKSYVLPMVEFNIDHLVLGCTHYPYLIPLLKEILPQEVKIVDSSAAVANHTLKILQEKKLLKTDNLLGYSKFYTNKDEAILQSFIKDFGIAEKLLF